MSVDGSAYRLMCLAKIRTAYPSNGGACASRSEAIFSMSSLSGT